MHSAGQVAALSSLCGLADGVGVLSQLVDGAGQYLVETRRLSYAPSASVLIRCIKEDERSLVGDRERILAIGNPDFNRSLFPNLPSLIDAENEATQSAKFYAASMNCNWMAK